jgi:hypothetical protein
MNSTATATSHLLKAVQVMVLLLLACGPLWGAEEQEDTYLTPEQLKEYQFERQPEPVEIEVNDLSVGQRFIMASQRRSLSDLVYRQLGVSKLSGSLDDLKILQRLVDGELIEKDDVKGWQAAGVVFGDLLAELLDLHWVQVEDEFGISKALQWKKTNNFVFPITMLSKRQQWNQPIDLRAIYANVEQEVAQFREPIVP